MEMFLASFLVMILVIVGMAVGVLNGRKAISGSCGGIAASGGKCHFCGGKPANCKKLKQE